MRIVMAPLVGVSSHEVEESANQLLEHRSQIGTWIFSTMDFRPKIGLNNLKSLIDC